MTRDLYEAETGAPDLYFASELDEQSPELKLQAGELFSADEVRDEIENPETPSYGDWIPVQDAKTGTAERSFCQAPSELVQEIQDNSVEPGDVFQITRCSRPPGAPDHAPYEVNVEVRDEA